jgi:hypothetical protein
MGRNGFPWGVFREILDGEGTARMRMMRTGRLRLWVLVPLLVLAACARNQMVLDLRGAVMYEKPKIREISHTVTDSRLEAGSIVVAVTMTGDPGLVGTFDISPGIADRQPMKEVEDGRYEGSFSFAPDIFGGPYWVTGRLRHELAGEHLLKDPVPLTITVPSR